MIGWLIGFFVVVIILIVVVSKRSEFDEKKETIEIGMSVQEVIDIGGQPDKVIEISDNTKLFIYTQNRWKGILFGGTETAEITITIVDNVVKSIA